MIFSRRFSLFYRMNIVYNTCNIQKVCSLMVFSVRLLVNNSRLLVLKSGGRQKLCTGFQLYIGNPNPCIV